MIMLKKALGIKPNELDTKPIGKKINWIDPEEELINHDKQVIYWEQQKKKMKENVPVDQYQYTT